MQCIRDLEVKDEVPEKEKSLFSMAFRKIGWLGGRRTSKRLSLIQRERESQEIVIVIERERERERERELERERETNESKRAGER